MSHAEAVVVAARYSINAASTDRAEAAGVKYLNVPHMPPAKGRLRPSASTLWARRCIDEPMNQCQTLAGGSGDPYNPVCYVVAGSGTA